MKIELLPFEEEMIPEAGKLLAAQHLRNRKSLSLLPPRFEDPQVAVKAVEAMWRKKFPNGYAAFRAGNMAAYLIGETTTPSLARSGYVYLPGYALAQDESADVMQDLYALVGEEWNQRGCFNHYLYISSANKDLFEAFFSLGFGKERADALMDFREFKSPQYKLPDEVEIRRAGRGDHEYLASLATLIAQHYTRAPRWHPVMPEEIPELRAGWAELAEDSSWQVWLALSGQEALGSIGYTYRDESYDDILVAPKCVHMSIAATKESARGRGISTALTWLSLEAMYRQGYAFCHTDWQTADLSAARFWPRFGFETVAYRLARKIEPTIAWAKPILE